MARFVTGNTFGTTDTVTATTLNNAVNNAAISTDSVDNSTIEVNSNALRIKDNGVTLAKMATQADQTVLGNVSGGTAVPTAVPIVDNAGILINNDSLGTNDTKGATQGNIKAYVDASSTDGFTPTTVSSGQKSVTLPNGLIMKFGTASSTSDGDETFTFTSLGHTAFPNECLSLTTGGMVSGDLTVSSTGFTINRFDTLSGTFTFFWQAIGR